MTLLTEGPTGLSTSPLRWIPACAGMTSRAVTLECASRSCRRSRAGGSEFRRAGSLPLHPSFPRRRESSVVLTDLAGCWIPACVGMTVLTEGPTGLSASPLRWIPACAGMTLRTVTLECASRSRRRSRAGEKDGRASRALLRWLWRAPRWPGHGFNFGRFGLDSDSAPATLRRPSLSWMLMDGRSFAMSDLRAAAQY
jgi:hypothetical protein